LTEFRLTITKEIFLNRHINPLTQIDYETLWGMQILTTFQLMLDYDGNGCFNLGLSYEEGKGVKQDAIASVIHKSKLKAANAKIQITRLLEKLERL
jgi:TPR repeat protein